ncbi:hypothetical protein D3C78_1648250 [compost metagenome]
MPIVNLVSAGKLGIHLGLCISACSQVTFNDCALVGTIAQSKRVTDQQRFTDMADTAQATMLN